MVQPLKLGYLSMACDYLSMLGSKLNSVSKRGHRSQKAYSKSFTTKRKRTATESALQVLNLLVLKPDCFGMTIKYHGCGSAEFLTSLGHQQPWYWLRKIPYGIVFHEPKFQLQMPFMFWDMIKLQICTFASWNKFGTTWVKFLIAKLLGQPKIGNLYNDDLMHRIHNAINNSLELRFLCIKPSMKAWRNRQPALSDVGRVVCNVRSYQINFIWSLLVPLFQLICLDSLLSYAMSTNSESCQWVWHWC